MKHLLITFIAVFALTGCGNDGGFIDLGFLGIGGEEPPPATECPAPETPQEVIYAQLNDLSDRIDVNSVNVNHYVNAVSIEESNAELFDSNGSLITQNVITLPEYIGEPMRHVLVVEFYQTN